MRQRVSEWGPEQLANKPIVRYPGDEVVLAMERDLYLLWERWGYDGMPDTIRLHPTLRVTIEMDMPHRMIPVEMAIPLMRTDEPDQWFKFKTPQMRTLYGPIYLLDDPLLKEWVWMFDHFDAWKTRMEQSFAQMVFEERRRDANRTRLSGPGWFDKLR